MFAKKAFLLIPTLLMTSPLLFSCNKQDPNVIYLKVLNSEDYIADGIIEEFEKSCGEIEGEKVKVIYETFDTMENMFNTLKTGKTKYDLVCASDYMVQKLVNLDLLEPIEQEKISVYTSNVSPFIDERLESIKWGEDNQYNLKQYSVCYMWGTLGILYNPTYSLLAARGLKPDDVMNDMKSYNALWNGKYQKTISIKDSMRDTYAIGLIHSFQEDLKEAGTDEEKRQLIFDRGGEDDPEATKNIEIIKKDLLTLRDNIFGFEVDSGKEDIVTEKIGVDTAWSGDAVKAIHTAEEDKNLMLYYSIPEEGSNLWFDCWTMQKGANKDLAYKFLDFISKPSNAIENMKEIGYTSAMAGDEVKSYFGEKYAPISSNTETTYDLGYFFGDATQLPIDDTYLNRQITAQFPPADEANKLMVMKDYGENNDLILKMWEEVKHEALPTWAIALFVVEIAIIATGIIVVITLRIRNKNRRKARKNKTA